MPVSTTLAIAAVAALFLAAAAAVIFCGRHGRRTGRYVINVEKMDQYPSGAKTAFHLRVPQVTVKELDALRGTLIDQMVQRGWIHSSDVVIGMHKEDFSYNPSLSFVHRYREDKKIYLYISEEPRGKSRSLEEAKRILADDGPVR